MRTQIAKTAHLPAEYIPPTFWLVPPPPFPQVDTGGCYRENFFLILFFSCLLFDFYSYFIFLFFSDSVIVLVWFWLSNYRLIVSIFNISIFTRFGYAWLPSSTRLIFARYSSSNFSLCIISYWFSLWILIFSFTIFDSDYNFGFCVFRFWISTRFYSLNFTCFNLCRFYALTLLLVIKNIYAYLSLFYACFGYFKAFWRVFVCFRCSLSSWDKIMCQKA